MLGTTWARFVMMTTRETYGNNFQHLLAWNITVTIQVIHREGPFEFLFEFPPRRDRERAKKLPEVNCTIAIGVECPEHVLCKLTRIAIWKEIPVNFFKLVHAQMPARTVFQKPLIPFLNFSICKKQLIWKIQGLDRAGLTFNCQCWLNNPS